MVADGRVCHIGTGVSRCPGDPLANPQDNAGAGAPTAYVHDAPAGPLRDGDVSRAARDSNP
jgi:hypothetical protein